MQWRRRRIVIHVAWGKAVGRRGSSATSTALSAHRRFVFFVHILLHQMQKDQVILLRHKVRSQKNKRYYLGIFPKRQTPPPPPPFGNPLSKKIFSVYFAFQDHRNIFGFQQNVKNLPIFLHLLLGIGDPPLPDFPNSQNSHFFLRNERNQINLR